LIGWGIFSPFLPALSGSVFSQISSKKVGKFTVYVTYAGSESYYSSYAETAFGVDAVATTVTPTATPTSVVEQYFIPVAGLILVIALIGAVLSFVLLLRKKP
jgi:hypothetical protein